MFNKLTVLMAKNYGFYSRRGRPSSKVLKKKLFDVVRVKKSQFQEAIVFMENNFLDDPFVRAMGISFRHKETQNFLSKLWLTLLRSELSLATVHREKICGLCINCLQTYEKVKTDQNTDGDSTSTYLQLANVAKTEATRNLLRAWDKIDREVNLPISKINGEDTDRKIKILELAACTVGHNHRRLGIAKKMIQSSAELAMLLGFDYIRVDCTHAATAKICNELNWQKIWEMPFQKFDGAVVDFFDLPDEREKLAVQVYIKPLHSNLNNT